MGDAATGAGGPGATIRSASWWCFTWAPAASASLAVTAAWTLSRASPQVRAEAGPAGAGPVRTVPARALLLSQRGPAWVMRTARPARAPAVTLTARYPSPVTAAVSTQSSPLSRAAGLAVGQPERDRGHVGAGCAGRAGRGGPPRADRADLGREGPVQVTGDH